MAEWIRVKNPDPKRVYKHWYYCKCCGETFTEAPEDAERMRKHPCKLDAGGMNVFDVVPTEINIVSFIRMRIKGGD